MSTDFQITLHGRCIMVEYGVCRLLWLFQVNSNIAELEAYEHT